jgi:mannan endo-1,4-beta-mannosidase
LQSIVDDNRTNNRITILCAFVDGTVKLSLLEKSPSKTSGGTVKVKLAQWAVQFKTNPMLDQFGMVL